MTSQQHDPKEQQIVLMVDPRMMQAMYGMPEKDEIDLLLYLCLFKRV